jgi:hypothetical protein
LAKPATFGVALELLFQELGDRWLSAAPGEQIITDERVLRELSLPLETRTRLCYFAVPVSLLAMYREIVFPLADDAGLIPASGDEIAAWEANARVMLDSLLQRSHAVIADVSTSDSRVWNEVRAAALRRRPPQIALIAGEEQVLGEEPVPGATVFKRPGRATSPDETRADDSEQLWLERLQWWLRQVGEGATLHLEVEALQLLEQGMYRPAVISVVSALEVALQDALERKAPELVTGTTSSRSKRPGSPLLRLLQSAVDVELITPQELEPLREVQQVRNALVHTKQPVHGRKARRLVEGTADIVRRLRLA